MGKWIHGSVVGVLFLVSCGGASPQSVDLTMRGQASPSDACHRFLGVKMDDIIKLPCHEVAAIRTIQTQAMVAGQMKTVDCTQPEVSMHCATSDGQLKPNMTDDPKCKVAMDRKFSFVIRSRNCAQP